MNIKFKMILVEVASLVLVFASFIFSYALVRNKGSAGEPIGLKPFLTFLIGILIFVLYKAYLKTKKELLFWLIIIPFFILIILLCVLTLKSVLG